MWEFRTFGTLPEPGGLWDQPAGLLAKMRYAERVYNVFDTHNRAPDRKTWDGRNPGALKFKLAIEKMRRQEPTDG
ncbi:MAG: hypothetical protein ABI847_11505 [Anaerolineales bacterium]